MKPELANVIAHIQGDGCVNIRKDGRVELNYTNTEIELIEDFRRNFKKQFGVEAWRPSFRETAILTGSGKSELIKEMAKYKLKNWTVPKEVFEGSEEVRKVYLRAFFDDEGTVTLVEGRIKNKNGTVRKFLNRKIKLYSKSLGGLEDVQKLLLQFEIRGRISKPMKRDVYELNVADINSILKFSEKVGFVHPRKILKLKEVVSSCPSM